MFRAQTIRRQKEKGIVELPNYDILCNPEYTEKFMYSSQNEVRHYLYNHFICEEETKQAAMEGARPLAKKD